jgi:transposase
MMLEPTACDRARPRSRPCYCDRCDLLVGLDGFHVIDVDQHGGTLRVVVETPAEPMGCRTCGAIVHSHGRRDVNLIDVPCLGRPTRLVWRKRTWRCAEDHCPTRSFTEQHDDLAGPRALLTIRACWWAINQLRREHASVAGLARQLGTTWRTVWRSIKPLLEQMAAAPDRFNNVSSLGVDDHVSTSLGLSLLSDLMVVSVV